MLLAERRAISDHWIAFGAWVRKQRENTYVDGRELGQAEAARRAGLSRTHWIMMEKGETGTKRSTLPRIAVALAIPPEDHRFEELFSRAGFTPPTTDETSYVREQVEPDLVREREPDADAPETLRWLEGLPPGNRTRKEIEDYIRFKRQQYEGRDPRDE